MPILLLVIILGIVEGVTEYLPVSSTGHLILAIVILYWRTFRDVIVGLFQKSPSAWAFTRNLAVAFAPAVVLGLAIGDYIELLLGNATVVAWALIIGGFAILAVERFARPEYSGGVAEMSLKQSTLVGIVQCLAMIPGVSRSGATILGAMSLGIDRRTAAEFSFFLAVPTLTGATVLQLYKHGAGIGSDMIGYILLGSLVSFVVAFLVVKAFLAVITRFGFGPFAWYRIIAGVAALIWLAMR